MSGCSFLIGYFSHSGCFFVPSSQSACSLKVIQKWEFYLCPAIVHFSASKIADCADQCGITGLALSLERGFLQRGLSIEF